MNNPSFVITGLAGKKTLSGTIKINGAKNAALKAMAAAVLFDGKVRLENIPHTADIDTMVAILEKLGAKVGWVSKNENKQINKEERDHTLEVDTSTINSTDIDPTLASGMRASVVLTGPLLARFGKVSFPQPGGCVIGARPIDLFLEGYKTMGATVTLKDKLYHISAPKGLNHGKTNNEFFFHKISVGGTETLMMAAALAHGKTVLKNCAKEPEIVNVAEWLISSGAKIKGVGTETIEVEGTGGKLFKAKKHYTAIPDRIEAGSFLILGALCAKDLTIEKCEPKHMESLIHCLQDSGVPLTIEESKLIIKGNVRPNSSFKSFNIQTREYPGFVTDLQAPIVTYLTQVTGEAQVDENIFEGRFKYVEDLAKLGAKIKVLNPGEIKISGPTLFDAGTNTGLCAHDIRAGFAIVLAALAANGKSTIKNIHLIDRGYEKLEEQLRKLGADIKRVL